MYVRRHRALLRSSRATHEYTTRVVYTIQYNVIIIIIVIIVHTYVTGTHGIYYCI